MSRLENIEPFSCEADQESCKVNEQLRVRVLKMLAEDKGEPTPEIPHRKAERVTGARPFSAGGGGGGGGGVLGGGESLEGLSPPVPPRWRGISVFSSVKWH